MTQTSKTISAGELQKAFSTYVRDHKYDPSLIAILAGNLFAMAQAILLNWTTSEVMWVYWGQSVLIGVMNFIRMWNLEKFSTAGMTSNGRPIPETKAGARGTAIFFMVHYGFFHLGYAVFLAAGTGLPETGQNAGFLILAVLGFLFSHLFSLSRNIQPDLTAPTPNLGTIMFMPYLRILPMHLGIVFGVFLFGASALGIFLFMAMKTVADGAAHMIEHFIYQDYLRKYRQGEN